MESEFKQAFIRNKASQNVRDVTGAYVLWSRHAIQELVADDLTRSQVEQALQICEIIEDYPTLHRPLPDCLVLGRLPTGEPVHVVVAIDVQQDRIFVVTVYRPDSREWKYDWRTRK
ncbi:MAG: DUF4258 domain-containing protein [Anaerolineae bacterium]